MMERETLLREIAELSEGIPESMLATFAEEPTDILVSTGQSLRKADADRRRFGTLGAHWSDTE